MPTGKNVWLLVGTAMGLCPPYLLARRMKQVARNQRISVAYIGRKGLDSDVATRMRPTLN